MQQSPIDLAPIRVRRLRAGLILATIVMGALSALLITNYLLLRNQLVTAALTTARSEASRAVATIDGALLQAQATAEQISADLASGDLVFADVTARLIADLEANPDLDGLAVTCEPFVCDPALRLAQVYVYRDAVTQTVGVLDVATYDYTLPPSAEPGAPQTAWYYHPLREGPQWGEPFLATGAAKVLIEYGTPFARPGSDDPRPGGVVTADFSLVGMRSLVSQMDLGIRGYGFITSQQGTFFAHPDPQFVAQLSIFDPASRHDPAVQAAARQALAGETVEIQHVDSITGRQSWFYMAPLLSNQGMVAVVLDAADLRPPSATILRQLSAIGLSLGLFVVLLLAVLVRAERGQPAQLWVVALSFTFISVCLIMLTWWLNAFTRDHTADAIADTTAVERILTRYKQGLDPRDQPLVVPTGIEITAIQFPNATSTTLNATIWQRYHDDLPDDLERGFILPQTIGELLPIEEAAVIRDGDADVLIWRVGIVLQQRFDPSRFPFDTRNVTIRILPAEIERNVVLVPDLAAYPMTRPSALPGLAEGMRLNDWRFESSFFTLQPIREASNLGVSTRTLRPPPPQLTFMLNAQRNVVGPFIAYLIPGLVTLALVFAFLMSDRQLTDQQDLVAALSYAAALFFVIAVAHNALRDSVAAIGITYLEHLYLLLYVIVLAVIIDALLLVRAPWLPLITYGEHLLPKLLYWPLCTLALLVATLVTFVWQVNG
ncbi:MAG: hypothetical protein AB4911_07580 [Oscillochloridaceae bacterium umkhey_bin13]